jgi:hypothetical protein
MVRCWRTCCGEVLEDMLSRSAHLRVESLYDRLSLANAGHNINQLGLIQQRLALALRYIPST